jgi:hypothetical protein
MADYTPSPNNVLNDDVGNTPIVSQELTVENRTISNAAQAYSVCDTLVSDWKKGILNAARITSKLNGERPYNQKKLKDSGKDWKTNISTGFLASECGKVIPRFYMPIKTAKYLTASELPPGWPNGVEKTQHFRQTITDAVRNWPKFNFYVRGLSREVAVFGFGFNVFFDEYEWRPTLMRMDKGFVPQGTEVMEEPQFFMAKYDYKPSELLSLLRSSVEAGRTEWNVDNVVAAINAAYPPPVDSTYPEARSYEELIRQATWGYSYTKGAKMIRTYHLFAKETTGRVSHYVLLSNQSAVAPTSVGSPVDDSKMLYQSLDQFESMDDVVNTMVFDYGDGTVHGAWGVGQILYDLAVQVEKIRCDSIDNIRLTNKVKIQVPDAKNINDVKQLVNDQFVIVSGAQFSANTAGLTSDVMGYEALDTKMTRIAQEKIGAFIPPIPMTASDITAAQINASSAQERELREALLENWLIQFAHLMRTITKRLVNPDSPDPVARETIEKLLAKLTPEEIAMLAAQFPVKSVMDFTEFKAQQRGAFAANVMNNPLFRQSVAARYMAEGVGDESFVDSLVLPEGDQNDMLAAQRQQILENAALATGQPVPVVTSDNDWVHMQTLKPVLTQAVQGGMQPAILEIGLQHYAAHWQQGVAKKTIPKDQINEEKSFIASVENAINALKEQAALAQQAQAVGGIPMPAGPMV